MEGHIQKGTWVICGRCIVAAVVAAFLLIGAPLLLSAAGTSVVINEVMWMGSGEGANDEWIELKNTTANPIDLTGWTIAGAGSGSSTITIAAGTIPANGYFLIGKYASTSSAINDGITIDLVLSNLSLVNSGTQLILKNSTSASIDSSPTGTWQEGNNNDEPENQRNSMERNSTPGIGANWSSWHTCLAVNCNTATFWDIAGTDYGTPKATNSDLVVLVSPSPTILPSSSPASPDPNEEYSDAIIINEFLPNPIGADADGEFIELKNTGEDEVDLKDWQLDDGEGGSSAYEIPEGTLIAGGGIIVFLRPNTGLALNNGGDDVRLFSPDKEIRDEHTYNESVAEGVARARNTDGVWQWSTTPTLGEENVISQEQEEKEESEDEREYSDAIVINEFLPNPTGSDADTEFIELKNTGEEEIDLEGWQLDDGEGGSGRYDIGGETLSAGEVKVFWRSDTKIALNNGGDEVRLFSPNGEEKSSYTYEESVSEDISYNRTDDGEYVLSTTTTPSEQNIITELEEGAEKNDGSVAGATVARVSLKNVRGQAVGTIVEVEGVVSAPPGVFGDKIMYLAGSGIQIYFYREDYPELEVGDKVKLRGELAMSLGEYRIKLAAVEDVIAIGKESSPQPHQVRIGEIGEDKEGWLVIISGRVTRTSGDTFYVDDGSGEIKVFIKRTTGIDKPKMKKGMNITITGVVSETKSGYRVLPRWQTDISAGLVAGMQSFPTAGENAFEQKYSLLANRNNIFLGLLIFVAGYLLFSAITKKEPLIAKYQ